MAHTTRNIPHWVSPVLVMSRHDERALRGQDGVQRNGLANKGKPCPRGYTDYPDSAFKRAIDRKRSKRAASKGRRTFNRREVSL